MRIVASWQVSCYRSSKQLVYLPCVDDILCRTGCACLVESDGNVASPHHLGSIILIMAHQMCGDDMPVINRYLKADERT